MGDDGLVGLDRFSIMLSKYRTHSVRNPCISTGHLVVGGFTSGPSSVSLSWLRLIDITQAMLADEG